MRPHVKCQVCVALFVRNKSRECGKPCNFSCLDYILILYSYNGKKKKYIYKNIQILSNVKWKTW